MPDSSGASGRQDERAELRQPRLCREEGPEAAGPEEQAHRQPRAVLALVVPAGDAVVVVVALVAVAAGGSGDGVCGGVVMRRLDAAARPRAAAASSNNHAAHAQHEGQEREPGGAGPAAVREEEPHDQQYRAHLNRFVQPVQSGKAGGRTRC